MKDGEPVPKLRRYKLKKKYMGCKESQRKEWEKEEICEKNLSAPGKRTKVKQKEKGHHEIKRIKKRHPG